MARRTKAFIRGLVVLVSLAGCGKSATLAAHDGAAGSLEGAAPTPGDTGPADAATVDGSLPDVGDRVDAEDGGGPLAGDAPASPGDAGGGERSEVGRDQGLAGVPCAAGGFTACVPGCSGSTDAVTMAAICDPVGHYYYCPEPWVPAASCPPESWPSGPFASCGPWVQGYDRGCRAVCDHRIWTCPASACTDAGSHDDGG